MKRHALFVGVNAYDDKTIRPLRYSIPDASVLADRFKGFGYSTRLLADPTGAELKSAVMESVEGLGSGDVFLFFFAGHGFTSQDGAHLLFCRDDMQRLLRVNAAGTRVDAIEALTADGGFHRAFLLDSCRTDCYANVECRGGGTTRDLDFVSVPKCTKASGSFYLLRSCDKFRPSLEFDAIGHGLFTQGLLDAMDARDNRLAYCDTSFATAVGGMMEGLQRDHHVTSDLQRPSIGEVSGPTFSLFSSGCLDSSKATALLSSYVLTPNDGAVPPRIGNVGRVPVAIKGKRTLFKAIAASAAVVMVALAAWIWADYPDADDPLLYPPQERYKRGESFLKRWWFRVGNEKNALKWIEGAAKDGLSDAQFEMGAIMEDGKFGMGKNEIEALKWYELAAKQNHIGALCKMGLFWFEGRGGSRIDYKKAFSYLYSAATNGLSMAQKAVGDCYRTGECVGETNMTEAVRFYDLAAAQGDAGALFELYRIFRYGAGNIASNENAAVTYLKRAEEAGSSLAMIDLGYLVLSGKMGFCKNPKKAFELFSKAAKKDHVVGQYNLGICYRHGEGVKKDDRKAFEWCRKAAERGYAKAQDMMGDCYFRGNGTDRDDKEAASWFRKAADQGLASAQNSLGICYYCGRGVDQNYTEAVKWFEKAVGQNDKLALLNLGRCYFLGNGVVQDDETAVEWFRKAAVQGHAGAQYALGLCYENGRGVGKDPFEAIKWYRAAAEQGDEDAKKALERLR